jgi:hypothetical protein
VVCLERERSTLALRLARQVAAVYLRIDTIERAIVAGEQAVALGEEGYRVAYAVADDTELSSGSIASFERCSQLVRLTLNTYRQSRRAVFAVGP